MRLGADADDQGHPAKHVLASRPELTAPSKPSSICPCSDAALPSLFQGSSASLAIGSSVDCEIFAELRSAFEGAKLSVGAFAQRGASQHARREVSRVPPKDTRICTLLTYLGTRRIWLRCDSAIFLDR